LEFGPARGDLTVKFISEAASAMHKNRRRLQSDRQSRGYGSDGYDKTKITKPATYTRQIKKFKATTKKRKKKSHEGKGKPFDM